MSIRIVAASEWVFGINDPSIIAWVIVFFYFLGSFFCWRARSSLSDRTDLRKRALWLTLGVFLLFFGFNKQLDLHDLVMGLVRDMSSSERRSIAWNGFFAFLAISMIGAALGLGRQ